MRRSPRPSGSTTRSRIAVGMRSRAYAESDRRRQRRRRRQCVRPDARSAPARCTVERSPAPRRHRGHRSPSRPRGVGAGAGDGAIAPDHDTGERAVRAGPHADRHRCRRCPATTRSASPGTCSPSCRPRGTASIATRPQPPSPAASIRRLGDVCEFSFAGRAVTVRSTKGVDDLLRLIEADGREIHCLDLVGVGGRGVVDRRGDRRRGASQLRATHPRPAGGDRRGRGQQRLRPRLPAPGRARHPHRASHRGARPRQPHTPSGGLRRASAVGGDTSAAHHDPAGWQGHTRSSAVT